MAFYRGCLFGTALSLLFWLVVLVTMFADEMTIRGTLSVAGLVAVVLAGLGALVFFTPQETPDE